jgi:hypothetical protein
MYLIFLRLVLFLAFLWPALGSTLELERLRVGTGGDTLFQEKHKVILRDNQGHFHRLYLRGGKLQVDKLSGFQRTIPEMSVDALPDGVMSDGKVNILRAWLTGPTDRYDHGILGDGIEASGLAVDTITGTKLTLTLPKSSVFEDRQARLLDVDGDGVEEIVAVRSYLHAGAALAVMSAKNNKLQIIAETPAIGMSNRWLNPIGVGDFDGDGGPEIAYIETPHIGGILKVFRLTAGDFSQVYSAPGFSNHAIGSREQGLSAIFDANGDGAADILLPDARRRQLRLVSFQGGNFRELGKIAVPGKISSGFYQLRAMERTAAVVFLNSAGDLILVEIPGK